MDGEKKGLSNAAISLWVAVVFMLLYLAVGVATGALVFRDEVVAALDSVR